MNKRMLDGSIWANEKFSEMPPMACLLLIGLINLADDQGRMKAHPAYLRSQIFPYRDVTLEDVSTWLATIAAHGTALAYAVDGKDYLQLVNWWEYQGHSFAAPSDYPRPEGWQDRLRFTGKSRVIYTCNWIISSGETLEDTCDQDGNPLQKQSRAHAKATGQPHARPHAKATGQPVTPLIEDKDKDNTTTTTEGGSGGGSFEILSDETQVIRCWEENIDPSPPSIVTDDLKAAVLEHGKEAVLDAIAIAVRADNHTMRYVKGVLNRRGSPEVTNSNGYHKVLVPIGADNE